MKKIYHRTIYTLFILFVFLTSPLLQAEGSKDIYPTDAKGGRASLRSSNTTNEYFPFATQGTHYVYAKAGETISLASSSQNGTAEKIMLYRPNGTKVSLSFLTGEGRIAAFETTTSRAAELAGPRLPNQSSGANRYKAIYYTVPSGGEGIYRVHFIGGEGSGDRPNILAKDNWTQTSNDSQYILAWDVSVSNVAKNAWIKGRVYATVFNLDIATVSGNNFRGDTYNFYGKFKVLTKDGYVYNVDNNGNNGYAFTFMVNNKGFYKTNPSIPSYESKLAGSAASITNYYHNPNTADANGTVTHKIFYNKPALDLPENSIGAVPGNNTWLKTPPAQLSTTEMTFEGVDGVESQSGLKGGYFKFSSISDVTYTIVISPISPANFPSRTLTGTTNASGENKVWWNGKDGAGNFLPVGTTQIQATLQLKGAEVHFPYVDMEINPNGIILELLNEAMSSVVSDVVYWNDTPVSTGAYSGPPSSPLNNSHLINPNGTSSNVNGHKWGSPTGATVGAFGDKKGMDTWTFIVGNKLTKQFEIKINIADLEVVSLTTNHDACIQKYDEITYEMIVKNNGPTATIDAPFSFIIPQGFSPVSAIFNNSLNCGSQFEAISFDVVNHKYVSKLSLPANCEVKYIITVKLDSDLVNGIQEFFATILRPDDFTDPDATNQDLDVPPTDPFYECANNGLGGDCNNIKSYTLTIIPEILSVIATDIETCEAAQGKLEFTFKNIPDGEYTITYDGGNFTNIIVTNGTATVENLIAGEYKNLRISINGCISEVGIDAEISDKNCICYKDGKFDATLSIPTQVGISSLRSENTDGWPQVREGAWIALESKTKGFVPNRLTTLQIQAIPSINLVIGMMVYNVTEDCLQINIDGTETGWKCFSAQGCESSN